MSPSSTSRDETKLYPWKEGVAKAFLKRASVGVERVSNDNPGKLWKLKVLLLLLALKKGQFWSFQEVYRRAKKERERAANETEKSLTNAVQHGVLHLVVLFFVHWCDLEESFGCFGGIWNIHLCGQKNIRHQSSFFTWCVQRIRLISDRGNCRSGWYNKNVRFLKNLHHHVTCDQNDVTVRFL